MRHAKKLTPVKDFIVFNNPLERWRQMSDIMEGNYYISSEGRVMKMTCYGIFREVKTYFDATDVKVMLYDKKARKQRKFRVCRLVMIYFKEGYYARRKIAFKNNDRLDCSLKNLYWFSGFDTVVDYKYLRSLNPKYLNYRDVKVTQYFLTKDVQILFDLIEKNIPPLLVVLSGKGLHFDIRNNVSTIVLELIDILESGRYKPVSNRVRYKTQDFFGVLANITLSNAAKELKIVYTDDDNYLDRKFLKAV